MVTVLWASGCFEGGFREGAVITCEVTADCVGGLVCVQDRGTCVPVSECVQQNELRAAYVADGTRCEAELGTRVCLVGTCVDSICGDGVVDARLDEACDDGNEVEDDACLSTCLEAGCGDGIPRTDVLDPQDPRFEACDDGNSDQRDACRNDCSRATCGDLVVRLDLTDASEPGFEACDEGPLGGPTCTATCRVPGCGDGILQRSDGEECEDDNESDTDGCVACREARCGDGVRRQDVERTDSRFEACDDGNTDDDDACTNACTDAVCGDGILRIDLEPGHPDFEACEQANAGDLTCLAGCRANVCGDGVQHPQNEQCDDGNLDNGDGCSRTCTDRAWQAGFAPGDLAPGRVAIGSATYVTEHATREVPGAPDWIFVMDQTNRLHALDPLQGTTDWTLSLDGVFQPPLVFTGEYVVFRVADGRLMAIPVDAPALPITCGPPGGETPEPEPFCLDVAALGSPAAALSVMVSATPPSAGGTPYDNFLVLLLLENGRVFIVTMPGGVLGSATVSQPVGTIELGGFGGATVDPGSGPRAFLQFAGTGTIMPQGPAGLRFGGDVCGGPVNSVPAVAGPIDPFTGDLAIITDGLAAVDGDLLTVRAQSGRVFRVELPATGASFLEETGAPCPDEHPPQVVRHHALERSHIPVMLLPLSGNQIIWVDDDQVARRGTMLRDAQGQLNDIILFGDLAEGVTFDPAGGAFDAEGGVYLIDSTGVMRKIHVVSAQQKQTWVVDAFPGLADAPIVAGGLVYLPLSDGRLLALEGGGPEPPLGSSWSRSGGSHHGAGHLGCAATDSSSALPVLLVLFICRRRRSSAP